MTEKTVHVWDPLVRVGHWLLVVCFLIAYVTEGDPLLVHIWAGYTIAAYVVIRVVWGFVGPKHARFTDFVYGPGAVFGYLGGLIRRRSPRFLGHSPAGGAMTVALLCLLAATTFFGMMTLADTDNSGPLARWFGNPGAADAVASGGSYESPYEEIHETFVNITLIFVFLHLCGVAMASWAHRENLPRSMVTGDKRSE